MLNVFVLSPQTAAFRAVEPNFIRLNHLGWFRRWRRRTSVGLDRRLRGFMTKPAGFTPRVGTRVRGSLFFCIRMSMTWRKFKRADGRLAFGGGRRMMAYIRISMGRSGFYLAGSE